MERTHMLMTGDSEWRYCVEFKSINGITVRIIKLEDAYKWIVTDSPNKEDIGMTCYTDLNHIKTEYIGAALTLTEDGKYIVMADSEPVRIVVVAVPNAYKLCYEIGVTLNDSSSSY